ncbi:MAG: glycosyltransferase [Candidatus Reddybacter sp.]
MDISLIICSYNRAHNLDDCFKHLLAQKNSTDINWELILVDNNSTDNTRTVVERYANESALNIRYSFEAQQGLSFARNHGIALADGTWVAFIDDDIRVSEVWLKTLHDTFRQYDCDAVGGRIHIESPQSLPQWISPDMYGFLGHQDFGTQAHPMDGYNEFPFGGNMAVHRRVFDKIGVFDTKLGRRGEGSKSDELFKGEETDFFQRLADIEGNFRYHPDLLVLHKILPYQLEKKFFLTLHKNAGILKAQQDIRPHQRSVMGIPLFVYPQLLRSIGHYARQVFSDGKNSAFRKRMNIAYFTGMMQAYRSASGQS